MVGAGRVSWREREGLGDCGFKGWVERDAMTWEAGVGKARCR